MSILTTVGNGVINYSGGIPNAVANYCDSIDQSNRNYVFCETLTLLKHRNVLLSASAGNNRQNIQFPANDIRAVAAGGTDANGSFWNESPGAGGVTTNGDPANSLMLVVMVNVVQHQAFYSPVAVPMLSLRQKMCTLYFIQGLNGMHLSDVPM